MKQLLLRTALCTMFLLFSVNAFAQIDVAMFVRMSNDIGKTRATILRENPHLIPNPNPVPGEDSLLSNRNFMGFSWVFQNGICVRVLYGAPFDMRVWEHMIRSTTERYGDYENPDMNHIIISWKNRPVIGMEIILIGGGGTTMFFYVDKMGWQSNRR